MAMKETLRRNGEHMLTVRTVRHLVGLDVVNVLAYHASRYLDVEELFATSLSRKAVEDVLRSVVSQGDGYEYWQDDVRDEDDADAYMKWARDHVKRLYPAMEV